MKRKILAAAWAAVAGCWAQLYSPGPAATFITSTAGLNYRDAAGDTRTLGVSLRTPAGTGPFPVVIWSHSMEFPADTLSRWAEATARAGYLTIVVSHPTRDVPQAVRLCEALQVSEEQCRVIGLVNWDRPQDLRQTLDWVERSVPNADRQRIALAGHSDGAGAVLSLAGARRLLTTTDRKKADDFSDSRPVAFVALSPQGALREGFYDAGWRAPENCWQTISRPALLVTGAGDNNCDVPGTCHQGDTPARRRLVFDAMNEGGKYLMFLKSVKVSHGLIGSLDPEQCGASAEECDALDRWMRSSIVAFLDAHVRQRPAAQAWLQESARRIAAAAGVQWEAK